METWQEMNVLARRIEAGELDKFLSQIGDAVSRRFTRLQDQTFARDNPGSGLVGRGSWEMDRALGAVLRKQQKHTFLPGDLIQMGEASPWRYRGLSLKVLRANPSSLWCRAVAGVKPDKLSGYQWFKGFKVDPDYARPVLTPSPDIRRMAAAIPLPGPKLVIGKKSPQPVTGDQ